MNTHTINTSLLKIMTCTCIVKSVAYNKDEVDRIFQALYFIHTLLTPFNSNNLKCHFVAHFFQILIFLWKHSLHKLKLKVLPMLHIGLSYIKNYIV